LVGRRGRKFFAWEQEEKLVPDDILLGMRARYADYKAGKVEEDAMCGELVTMHKGMIEAEVQRAATRFFDLNFGNRFPRNAGTGAAIAAQGCDVWRCRRPMSG